MKVLLFWIACFSITGALAQSADKNISTYLDKIGELHQLNGGIILSRNGREIAKLTDGYADLQTKQPTTANTHFDLCSISKLFTSTAILQLRDQGKLSLKDPVTKFLPTFPFPEVTVWNLLTHTSGLMDLELYEDLIRKYPDTVITNKNILPELSKWTKGLRFKPGYDCAYSNVNYSLLAMIAEKVSGQSFPAYLEQHIFRPAGMKDTYISIWPGRTFRQDKLFAKMQTLPRPTYDSTFAYADSTSKSAMIRYCNYSCSGTYGDTNIISTIGDLLLFDRAFFSGKLLKTSTMEEAFTPIKLNNGQVHYQQMDVMQGDGKMAVGLGWDIFEQAGSTKAVGHAGFFFGTCSFYWHQMDSKQAIIAYDNASGDEFGRIVTSGYYLLTGRSPLPIRTKRSLAFLYGSTLVKEGPDAAASIFNNSKNDTAKYYLDENEFNRLGGNLMYQSAFEGHQLLALEVFKINTFLFPDSFNTYDSYGQGLREMGKKKQAIDMYKKSIVLNPNNNDGKQALKELMEGK